MIKGKTQIELTDVKTGKVERFEDENMLTNAGKMMYNAIISKYALITSSAESLFPIRDMIYGGVKLFENTINEDVDNYKLPAISANKIIGYASKDANSTTDTRRGSRNQTETVELENGVQIVWDFQTDQSNGKISCVCLTSAEGGTSGFESPLRTFEAGATSVIDSGFIPVEFDEETSILTAISYTGTKKIRKYKIEVQEIGLLGKPFAARLLQEFEFEGTASLSSYYIRDSGGDYWYDVTSASTNQVSIFKIKKSTFDTTTENVTVNLPSSVYSSRIAKAIWNGYLYMLKNSLDGIYKIDLANPSNVVEISIPVRGSLKSTFNHITHYDGNMFLVSGLMVDMATGDYEIVDADFNVSGGSFYRIYNSLSGSTSNLYFFNIFNGKGFRFWHYGTSSTNAWLTLDFDYNALMSINNLETPVTKTADKTMKITYTLTYTN